MWFRMVGELVVFFLVLWSVRQVRGVWGVFFGVLAVVSFLVLLREVVLVLT